MNKQRSGKSWQLRGPATVMSFHRRLEITERDKLFCSMALASSSPRFLTEDQSWPSFKAFWTTIPLISSSITSGRAIELSVSESPSPLTSGLLSLLWQGLFRVSVGKVQAIEYHNIITS
jgi:hypothetical protein